MIDRTVKVADAHNTYHNKILEKEKIDYASFNFVDSYESVI